MRTFVAAAVLVSLGSAAQGAQIVVNQTVDVQPGTRLIVTQGGTTLMNKGVEPGRVHIHIEYVDRVVRHRHR